MLFIDDNEANIAAAVACGWQGHHFTDAGRLADDLRRLALIA
jgi:2-haloacid dehalogenase